MYFYIKKFRIQKTYTYKEKFGFKNNVFQPRQIKNFYN